MIPSKLERKKDETQESNNKNYSPFTRVVL